MKRACLWILLLGLFLQQLCFGDPLDNWTLRSSGTGNGLARIVCNNGLFVAVGRFSSIFTSQDGINWIARNSGINDTFGGLYGVTYGNGLYVTVGGSPFSELQNWVLTSRDGTNWARSTSVPGSYNVFQGITYGNGMFITVGASGTIFTSTDATNWIQRTSGVSDTLTSVAYGNGLYVAVGGLSSGEILTSSDGISWNVVTLGDNLQSITYGKGRFVAVGNYGFIATSSDGISWTQNYLGTWLAGVSYGGGVYVAVGENGAILTSLDGLYWIARNSATANSLSAVCYGRTSFVGVGDYGTIVQSQPLGSAAPIVESLSASSLAVNSAQLNGIVDPDGLSTTAYFDYGTTTTYGKTTIPTYYGSGLLTSLNITSTITGLAPNTLYHCRVVAYNGGGISYGQDTTFSTLPVPQAPPSVQRSAASAVTTASAKLNAFVNPNGADTMAHFEYGTTIAYGSSTPTGDFGVTPQSIGYTVTGLSPNTLYHFHVVANNSGGTSVGGDMVFTTAALPAQGSSVSGQIFDATTGNPISGATVQLGANSTPTDVHGDYSFSSVAAGNYTLSASKTGYTSTSLPLSVTPGSSPFQTIALYPVPASSPLPTVTSVSSKYSGSLYFLDGVSFPVTFTANVNWANHPPGVVRFITPKGGNTDVATSGSTASAQLDVGSAFGPGGQLQVTGISSDGSQSIANVPSFVVMKAIPSVAMQVVDTGSSFYYHSTLAPNFQFLDAGLPSGINFDSSIPLFGSNPFDLSFLPSLDIAVNGNHADYQLDVSGSGLPKLDLAGQELDFSPQLQAFGNYDSTAGQWNWGGSLGLGADLDISKSWPFIVTLGVVPVPMFAKADLDLSANATLNVLNLYPTTLSGTLAVDPQVTGTLGVGVDSVVNVAGWISGGADFTFQYPMSPPLQQYSINLSAGVSAYALGFSWQDELFIWDWPQNAGPQVLNLLSLGKPALPHPYPRNYLNKLSYAAFDGRPSSGFYPALRPMGQQSGVQTPTLYAMQTDVFPFSESSISASGTNCYAVWLYDNPIRTLNNRTMLVFSRFDGTNWSEFSPVADDGTADFHPQLQTFTDGSAVVAWENEGMVLPTNADFTAMTTNLEIATAFYDPAAGAWQPMQQLTTNGYLDRSPRIAGPSETNLMLVWVANTNNDLEGSDTNINQLWFTTWDGSAWSAPEAFASVPYPLLKYDMTYNGTNAYLVMSLDADNALTNVNAHELFEVAYQNGTWGSLQQLTSDQVADDNPQMAIDPNGHVVLVWLKGNNLSSLVDFNFANQHTVATNEYSSNLGDFRLANCSDGRLAIMWAAPSPQYSSDLWGMFYDPNFEVWGNPQQLTADPETEMETAATFYSTNQLMALYDRVNIATGNTNQLVQDGTVITNANLYVLQYQLTNNLALVANSLIISPANPAPGDTVTLSVTVENLSASAVSNVLVAFYQGDPANGGTVIGQTNLAALLAPGATNVVSIPWTVPATTNALQIHAVVDPNHQFSDSDLLNNEAGNTFVEPDLAVQSVTWSQITSNLISVTATVINQGTIASQPATVSFLLDSVTGTTLFSTNIPSLSPGQSIDVNFIWNMPNLGNGVSLFTVVNTGTNADFNPQDQVMQATIQPSTSEVKVLLGPVTLMPGGVLQVSMTGLAGQKYLIQVSTDLVHWTTLTNLTLADGTGQFMDPSTASFPRRFYRAVVFSAVQPQLGTPQMIAGSMKQITVTGLPGQTYVIEASTNLVNWVTLTNVILPDSVWQFVDHSTNFNQRFYRAVLP